MNRLACKGSSDTHVVSEFCEFCLASILYLSPHNDFFSTAFSKKATTLFKNLFDKYPLEKVHYSSNKASY